MFPTYRKLESRITKLEQLARKLPKPVVIRLSVALPQMKSGGYWETYWSAAKPGVEQLESTVVDEKWVKAVEAAIAADGMDTVVRYFLKR